MSKYTGYRWFGRDAITIGLAGLSQADGRLEEMRRFEAPDGWVVQAFDFALDPTDGQAGVLARQFGGRGAA